MSEPQVIQPFWSPRAAENPPAGFSISSTTFSRTSPNACYSTRGCSGFGAPKGATCAPTSSLQPALTTTRTCPAEPKSTNSARFPGRGAEARSQQPSDYVAALTLWQRGIHRGEQTVARTSMGVTTTESPCSRSRAATISACR